MLLGRLEVVKGEVEAHDFVVLPLPKTPIWVRDDRVLAGLLLVLAEHRVDFHIT